MTSSVTWAHRKPLDGAAREDFGDSNETAAKWTSDVQVKALD